MSWWKVKYDFSRPNWQAFGHIAFVQAETWQEAIQLAAQLIASTEPGARLTSLDVNRATDSQYKRHTELVEARKKWLTNVEKGVPNQRGDL